MFDEYRSYLEANASALEGLVQIIPSLKRDARVLVLGRYGLIPAAIMKDIREDMEIEVLSVDVQANEDFRKSTYGKSPLTIVSSFEGEYDFIFAFLYLNTIPRSEAVPFLFDIHDHLSVKGKFYLIFPDALMVSGSEGEDVEAFYSKNERVFQKLYALSDVVHSLDLIGFQMLTVDEVALEGFAHTSAMLCGRR